MRHTGDWRALQDGDPDFITSLGPVSAHEAIELLRAEWPDVAVSAAEIMAFADGLEQVLWLAGPDG